MGDEEDGLMPDCFYSTEKNVNSELGVDFVFRGTFSANQECILCGKLVDHTIQPWVRFPKCSHIIHYECCWTLKGTAFQALCPMCCVDETKYAKWEANRKLMITKNCSEKKVGWPLIRLLFEKQRWLPDKIIGLPIKWNASAFDIYVKIPDPETTTISQFKTWLSPPPGDVIRAKAISLALGKPWLKEQGLSIMKLIDMNEGFTVSSICHSFGLNGNNIEYRDIQDLCEVMDKELQFQYIIDLVSVGVNYKIFPREQWVGMKSDYKIILGLSYPVLLFNGFDHHHLMKKLQHQLIAIGQEIVVAKIDLGDDEHQSTS
jgi:hypothetical protein